MKSESLSTRISPETITEFTKDHFDNNNYQYDTPQIHLTAL